MLFPCLSLLLLLTSIPSSTATARSAGSNAASSSSSGAALQESYAESLRITPLVDGKVHSEFEFVMRSDGDAEERALGEQVGKNSIAYHHTHLPPYLLSILTTYSISSFHLTLSSGRYSASYPPPSLTSSAPSGIQLHAYLALLEGETDDQEESRWKAFRGAVGGLFCAGLGETGKEAAGGGEGGEKPEWSFALEDGLDEREHRLYHLLLPRLSSTCTESLTPFLALLPCASHAGLSSLLNPHRLFDGDYTLIGAHYSIVQGVGEVKLVVGSVGDPIRSDRLKGGLGRRDFSMTSLYDRKLEYACPVASASSIKLVLPVNSMSPFAVEPKEGMQANGDTVSWDTSCHPRVPLDVAIRWESEAQFKYLDPSSLPLSPIAVRRLLTGYGQERGSIGVEVVNNLDIVAEVIWLEVWPWWVRGFISTLKGTIIVGNTTASDLTTPLITALKYSPPRVRRRPTTIEALLTLPPRTTAHFVVDYEASYLWYTEFPADAERGLELAGASFVLLRPSLPPSASSFSDPSLSSADLALSPHLALRSRGAIMRAYTPSSIISLPMPDFSMPYNVIILTSTIIALFFGSAMNALVRDWNVVDLEEREDGDTMIVIDGKIDETEGRKEESEGKRRKERLRVD